MKSKIKLETFADRLRYYRSTGFACVRNGEAISRLLDALAALGRRRTKDRENRGVGGTHEN